MPTCSKCLDNKPLADFHKAKRGTRRTQCKACRNNYLKGWTATHRDAVRFQKMRHRYGIGEKQYRYTAEKQGECCAICGSRSPGRGKLFHVDHDHIRGIFRGLLCDNCNKGLGHFLDNPDFLRSAADYVERFEAAQCHA